VLAYAERGEVDAAFVYRTDAAGRDRVRVAFEVPIPAGHAITYGAAVVAGSPHRALAEKFVAFLAGPRGEAMLRSRGFGPASGR
jgi:molybdate transport system substrate-binding protein